uniref:CWF19-like protein 2 n=1 Tax=Astatotilapia calliptera TaxID=8154 RepID=A0AAX7VZ96_ASTCA
MCCGFRNALLHTLVVTCGYLTYSSNNNNNGLHLHSAFQGTQSALQYHHSFTLTFSHWWRQATVVATAALGQTDRSEAAISHHRVYFHFVIQAKQQYDKEQRRKELKRQRGEDTWMLPEVNERLQQIEDVRWNIYTRADSRDEWMTFDFLAMKTTSTADRRAEKERQKEEERAKAQAIEQAGLHKLELNPYWKDGGTGLPPEEMTDSAARKGPVVNDGGLSWLRKSYQRMKEQAEREQRSLSDVVAERYGSMEEFQQRLDEAEEAMYDQKRREGDGTSRGGWRKGEEEYRERWKRKDEDGEDRDRWRKNEKDKDSSSESRERYHGGRGGYRGREEERGRDGDRYRENEKDRERNRNRDREGERDRDRGRGRDASREKDGDRCRDGEREKGRTDAAASSSGQSWNQRSLTLGSLQGRFLKPSEDDDSGESEFASRPFLICTKNEDREILLFRTDESGRAWPVNAPSGPQEQHGGRRKKKPIETHVDGERVRYFQDDDNVGLKEMVRREKMSSAQDQNALYSRMAAKMMGKTDGDNYTLDDMFVSSAAQREGEGREEERMRNKAIGESRRLAASMEKCQHCFSSKELQKHLIVAIGSKVYLSLPAGVSMTEGHCLICPLQHHCSATGMDEDIWAEMQLFRRTLVRMFEAQELDCVFMETHMNPRRRQHMVLECIPLPKELGDMAPIYFKKAIMECDEEWAMNKKVVDLSSKSIRQAVPRSLPYFAVDFGLQGGFAHVIENEQKFPHYFGKEVVGGMLDLEPRRWRKMIKENFDDQRKKVLQFSQWWKPHDCTKTQG